MRAISLQALLAACLVAVGSFEAIVAYFVFVTVAFLALTVFSLYRLPSVHGVSRVPGWPWTPLVFLAMLAITMVLLVAGSPREAGLGVAVVVAGIPVYRRYFSRATGEVSEPVPLEET